MDEQDRQAQHQLMLERHERVCAAIYNAVMLGLPEEDARIIAAECGIDWQDIVNYTQPVLRQSKEEDSTLEMDLPF